MQVREIAGYDEDVVFLMVPNESEFSRRVPLIIGTCTIGRIIHVIQESEIDHLSMPWAMAWMAQLLSCQKSMVVLTPGNLGKAQSEGASGGSQEVDMDELVTARESIHLGPFQTEIIEGWVKPLLGDMAHVMITPLKVGEGQLWEARPLPLGLHVLYTYTCLKNGSSRVSLMVRNMSDSHIILKKGVLVACLDGLAHWSLRNAAVARELVLAYHDVFVLESNELGCTSAIEHEIHINNSEPFQEQF